MQILQIQTDLLRASGGRRRGGRRQMQRLPAVVRSRRNYDPKVVSLGPYHHGEPHLILGESFKAKAVEAFITGSGKDKAFFRDNILNEISEIRACYDAGSTSDYDDQALSEMMLLDGCFIINHMEALSNSNKLDGILDTMGMVGFSYTVTDMFLIENQIPFRVISLLTRLRYDEEKGSDLLDGLLNFSTFHDSRHGEESGDDMPLHLLEALRRKLTYTSPMNEPVQPKWNLFRHRKDSKTRSSSSSSAGHSTLKALAYTSRSVTDLKAKGIYFAPSPTSCLKDVTFQSHNIFFARLLLPARFISNKSIILFSNLIAYELCASGATDYTVTSYVNLMKSMIHSARDVKELRERRILISNVGGDEEVMRVLREIETYDVENADIFDGVKARIEKHYGSRRLTWMAELVHKYFDSPWTAIALFAGVFLLLLTLAQTLFTIHPFHV
ncbi:UPF0481 protein At3g47200-like [Andrographis paniculata]|uniref:UPF0481 protein At3g47200-like n=1 Tax=Andrographis paniculata TaxID=175694 RepID=UPI0021E859C1|nr:UPF0481 protein At3g47200-like [Andrographis paniculata]